MSKVNGRAISDKKLKYKALDEDKSIMVSTDCLYLYDEYDGQADLFLTEGIFDALRLKSLGLKSMALS